MPDYNEHLFQNNLRYQITPSFNQRMSYPIAKGVGSNDGPSSCDNISDVFERLDEEITVEAVESIASCQVSLGIEERMVEEEEVHLEEENEVEAPVQIDVCGGDVVPEMSAYEKLRERNKRERLEYHVCETHSTLFGDDKMFNLQVGKSAVARNAGQGIFNRGKKVIPEGTVFGPYTGIFIPLSKYEELEKEGREFGNAWEVKDEEGKKVVGYVDPGINPDPETHWMLKVNCSMKIGGQNLVGFQLADQVYYRAKQDIPIGAELLVFYGDGYARELLTLDVKKYERYSGEEDQTEDSVLCEYCNIGLGSEDLARKHSCRAKKSAEQRRLAATGERKWICTICGKGFITKSSLERHGLVHTKVKAFACSVEGCDKKYTDGSQLAHHKKSVHEGVYHECEECGKRFRKKSHMTVHFKTVHNNERDYKCPTCGIKFGQRPNLTRHIKTVHDNIKSYECEHCGKSFGDAGNRKRHIEALHLGIRYSCTWRGGCGFTTGQKGQLPFHVRQVHTKEWSWECQLCEDQKGIWWGCLHPGQMEKHKAKNHPVEWEAEQEAFRQAHPHICKVMKCGKMFATKVEVDRHLEKLH